MSMRRLIWVFLVCFSMAVFMGQALSQTRGYGGMGGRSKRGRLRNTNREQKQQELEQRRLKQQIERQLKKQIGPAKSEKELKMKQILRATEKQWKAIEAKVNKVRELRSLANDVSIKLMCVGSMSGSSSMGGSSVGSGRGVMSGSMSGSRSGYGFSDSGGGGRGGTVQKQGGAGGSSSRSPISISWVWLRPSQNKGFENLNEGEKICEELFRLLEGKNSELEQIRQKMEALRKFRQEAKKELAIAQQELRQLVTPHQEAALVMMQLLD